MSHQNDCAAWTARHELGMIRSTKSWRWICRAAIHQMNWYVCVRPCPKSWGGHKERKAVPKPMVPTPAPTFQACNCSLVEYGMTLIDCCRRRKRGSSSWQFCTLSRHNKDVDSCRELWPFSGTTLKDTDEETPSRSVPHWNCWNTQHCFLNNYCIPSLSLTEVPEVVQRDRTVKMNFSSGLAVSEADSPTLWNLHLLETPLVTWRAVEIHCENYLKNNAK